MLVGAGQVGSRWQCELAGLWGGRWRSRRLGYLPEASQRSDTQSARRRCSSTTPPSTSGTSALDRGSRREPLIDGQTMPCSRTFRRRSDALEISGLVRFPTRTGRTDAVVAAPLGDAADRRIAGWLSRAGRSARRDHHPQPPPPKGTAREPADQHGTGRPPPSPPRREQRRLGFPTTF